MRRPGSPMIKNMFGYSLASTIEHQHIRTSGTTWQLLSFFFSFHPQISINSAISIQIVMNRTKQCLWFIVMKMFQ